MSAPFAARAGGAFEAEHSKAWKRQSCCRSGIRPGRRCISGSWGRGLAVDLGAGLTLPLSPAQPSPLLQRPAEDGNSAQTVAERQLSKAPATVLRGPHSHKVGQVCPFLSEPRGPGSVAQFVSVALWPPSGRQLFGQHNWLPGCHQAACLAALPPSFIHSFAN